MNSAPQSQVDRMSWLICVFRVVLLLAWAFTTGCISNWPSKPNWFNKDALPLPNTPLFGRESESITASELIWLDTWKQAEAESRATGKPILAEFTGSDWCSWCTKLEQDVFETPEFRSWAAENVVLLELDFPRSRTQSDEIREQNEELQARYGVKGFPTVLLLTADGQVLGKMKYMPSARNWIALAESQIGQSSARSTASRDSSPVDTGLDWK